MLRRPRRAGSVVHGFNKTIDWRVVRRLAAGSVPMTIVTLLALSWVGINSPEARDLITIVLAIALFVTAATLILRQRIVTRYAARLDALQPKTVAILTVIVGGILGVLVSITSVGAGAIGVTALILLYPRLATARIVGSDIAHAVPLTLAAGIGHWFLGSINVDVLLSLLAGSIPGILLGSLVAVRIPETALRLVLAATLIVVATKLVSDIHPAPQGAASASALSLH